MDEKKILNQQKNQWENSYTEFQDMFGTTESYPARKALELFKSRNYLRILELGAGQGRDTFYFGRNGIYIDALDYSKTAVNTIKNQAKHLDISCNINVLQHDIRKPLPYDDNTFDACYSHMLLCMAFTSEEHAFLMKEIHRVLKPHGLNIYTVRTFSDKHYGEGIKIAKDTFEYGGYIVHFFSEDKVRSLADGYVVEEITTFEEGDLPRKLYFVALKKKA